MTKRKRINIKSPDDLEKIEEDIIKAAEKSGKKNVIVNIFTYPHKQLKKRWHVRYKFNKKHLVMDSIIAGVVLFLIGLNIFWMWGGFHYFGNKMNIELIVQDEVVISGGLVNVEVKYSNENKFPVQDFNLSLNLPENYELKNVSRDEYDYEHNTISLGNLSPGANGSFDVQMIAFGNVLEPERFIINASYFKTNKKGERLWGQFNKTLFHEFIIKTSFVNFVAPTPLQLVKNQVFEIPVKIINEGNLSGIDITCDELQLRAKWAGEDIGEPGDFVVKNLAPGEESEFTISHIASATESSRQELSYELIWKKGDKEFLQGGITYLVEVFDPEFEVSFDLDVDGAVTPGDFVPIVVTYQNKGEYTIENLELKLDLSSAYWDTKNFKSLIGPFVQNLAGHRYVVWSYLNMPSLAIIQPGETLSFNLTVPIYNYVSGNASVNLSANTVQSYKVEGQEVQIYDKPLSVKLNSNLSVLAYPMYFASTGDQLGRGPIPPRVGQETKYWIFVKTLNDINDVENVTVSMKLPFNVAWLDESNVPIGDPLIYDPVTKTVSWKISKVPAGAENIGFAFQLVIIPTESQKGINPYLLTDIKVSGIDQVTGKKINRTLGAITTKLNYDKKGQLMDGVVK